MENPFESADDFLVIPKSSKKEDAAFLGKIPAKLKAWTITNYNYGWDWSHANFRKTGNVEVCKHTTIADASNSGTCRTAKNAHENELRLLKTKKGTVIRHDAEMVEFDNVPISGLRLIGAVTYGPKTEFIVKLPNDMVTYVQQDFIMDIVTNVGIDKNCLPGEYIFGQIDGKLELVRIGSALYDELKKADNRFRKEAIQELKLTPGRLYKNRSGNTAVFLGFANTINVVLKQSEAQKEAEKQLVNRLFSDEEIKELSHLSFTYNNWEMATIWLEGVDYYLSTKTKKSEVEAWVKEKLTEKWGGPVILKQHSYKEEVPNVELNLNFDVFQTIRSKALQDFKSKIKIHEVSPHSYLFDYNLYYDYSTPGRGVVIPDKEKKMQEQSVFVRKYREGKAMFLEAKEFIPLLNCVPWGIKPEVDSELDAMLTSLSAGNPPKEFYYRRP